MLQMVPLLILDVEVLVLYLPIHLPLYSRVCTFFLPTRKSVSNQKIFRSSSHSPFRPPFMHISPTQPVFHQVHTVFVIIDPCHIIIPFFPIFQHPLLIVLLFFPKSPVLPCYVRDATLLVPQDVPPALHPALPDEPFKVYRLSPHRQMSSLRNPWIRGIALVP